MAGPFIACVPFAQGAGKRIGAGIVEAHAIDQCAVGHGAEHARRVIARLGMARDTAQFSKAKPKPFPHWHGRCGFIHASSETNGVRKSQTGDFHGQIRRTVETVGEHGQHWDLAGERQSLQNAVVCGFRFLQKKQGSEAIAIDPAHRLDDLAGQTGWCRECNRRCQFQI